MKKKNGFTLIEIIVVVALIISATVILLTLSKNAGEATAVRSILSSALTEATGTATGSGNGATLVYIPPTASLNGEIDLYKGQPNGGFIGLTPSKIYRIPGKLLTINGQNSVSTSNFAIFINMYGRNTVGTWTPGSSTTTIPGCTPGAVSLSITYDGGSEVMNCGSGSFDSYDAHGTKII